MSIDEAVTKLAERLGDPEVFIIRHDGKVITVDVNFIYRVDEVKQAAAELNLGFPVSTGRRSCW